MRIRHALITLALLIQAYAHYLITCLYTLVCLLLQLHSCRTFMTFHLYHLPANKTMGEVTVVLIRNYLHANYFVVCIARYITFTSMVIKSLCNHSSAFWLVYSILDTVSYEVNLVASYCVIFKSLHTVFRQLSIMDYGTIYVALLENNGSRYFAAHKISKLAVACRNFC